MYRLIITNYEERQKEVMLENQVLRESLSNMQQELVNLLNRQEAGQGGSSGGGGGGGGGGGSGPNNVSIWIMDCWGRGRLHPNYVSTWIITPPKKKKNVFNRLNLQKPSPFWFSTDTVLIKKSLLPDQWYVILNCFFWGWVYSSDKRIGDEISPVKSARKMYLDYSQFYGYFCLCEATGRSMSQSVCPLQTNLSLYTNYLYCY